MTIWLRCGRSTGTPLQAQAKAEADQILAQARAEAEQLKAQTKRECDALTEAAEHKRAQTEADCAALRAKNGTGDCSTAGCF